MFKKKSNIYNITLIAVAFLITVLVYSKLPDKLPMHWNMAGEIDGYGAKSFVAFMSLGLMIFMWGFMKALPKIDPRKDNYLKFEKSYDVIISALITLFFIVHIIILVSGLGYKIAVDKILLIVMGLMLIILGNYMPKMKSNFFCGIKTPWTLSSEVSWKKTHRLGGKLSVAAGFIILLSSLVLKGSLLVAVFITVTLVATMVPVIASYFYAQNDSVNK